MAYLYNAEQKEATPVTAAYNKKLLEERDPERLKIELEDVADAKAHLILEIGNENIYDDAGNLIYDAEKYPLTHSGDFPDTVNPYLWQIRKDNEFAGVLKMAEGFYVVYGLEVAMVGFIRTEHGWTVVDAGNYVESARIVLKIAEKAVGEKIEGHIIALIYSHSHVDHYAGAEAFVSQKQVGRPEKGKIQVITPADYEQSLIDDNLYAGVAMNRRLQYQGGFLASRDEKGAVSAGLNQSILGLRGHMSMILPNRLIEQEETIDIDGVSLTFLPSPNTETRAHMCVYSNTHKVLFLGDNGMGTLHNTYTMRGAKVRDAAFWGNLYYQLAVKYGEEVEAIYQGHGVPHFKMANRPDNLKKYLLDNAAAYKYPSDQALLLANKGVKLNEIGRTLKIPDEISKTWYTRDHYGNYSQNARGAVQRYLGYYDGNPVNLFPLSEQELAKKLVEYIGSEEKVLEKAEEDFAKGEYQWVATITNHLVFLNPQNMKARYLCADTIEQLGYQTQSGLWRNGYLVGAAELRHPGIAKKMNFKYMDNREVMPYVSASLLLDYLAINFDGERAIQIEKCFVIAVESENEGSREVLQYILVHIYKGTILHTEITEEQIPEGVPVVLLTKTDLYELATKQYLRMIDEAGEQKEIIDILQEYVTDTSKYGSFHIIEPLEEDTI